MTPKTPAYPATPLPHNTAYRYLNGVIVPKGPSFAATRAHLRNPPAPHGYLVAVESGETLRPATEAESAAAQDEDIRVNGQTCHVEYL